MGYNGRVRKRRFNEGAPKMARIKQTTDFTLRLTTSDGMASSMQNAIAHGHDLQDVCDALVGCEWDASAFARILNANANLLYVHDWMPVRTTPRYLVAEGHDAFGNSESLYLRLRDGEPDMCDGITLKVALTNRAHVPLALSNIISRKCSVASFLNRLYEVADKWDAGRFAAAMNIARSMGATYDGDWKPVYTRNDKCAIAGRDGFGNEHTLVISRI